MHRCAGHTCEEEIEDTKLFCKHDWALLPKTIQQGIFDGVSEMDQKKIRYFKKQGIKFLMDTQGR